MKKERIKLGNKEFVYLSSIGDLKKDKSPLNELTNKGVYCVVAVVNKDNEVIVVGDPLDKKDRQNNKYEKVNVCNIVNNLSKNNLKIKNHRLLYIGKAEGREGLKQRLKQYINSPDRNPDKNGVCYKGHRGGRAIWQIENHNELLHLYIHKSKKQDDVKHIESELIDMYGIENLLNMRR